MEQKPKGSEGHDKLFKVRPIIDALRQNLRLVPPEEKQSIDEQIIPFKGRSQMKQYIKAKPHKWGFKVHLGSGLKIPKLKLDNLVYKLQEQRFVKDLSQSIYTTPELCARSVTGEPSRRFLKDGAKGKLPVTPAKMMALASGLMYYERAKKPEPERRQILELQTVVRDILKDFLPDVARQGRRRVQAPKE
ncbi:hypothetical protein HPB47_007572 [Ixodes persulcatus]|uniref:Uncharacterized protein n=1 Tax=Ixodes persulcatus TaxID=34615 RepID=A0AC60P7H5_IXOPE|nr:hypothetical protein HPB47_007572 [Ixodes persulcatus]